MGLEVSHWRHRLTMTCYWVNLLLITRLYGLKSSLKLLLIICWFFGLLAHVFFCQQIWSLRMLCEIYLWNLIKNYPWVIATCNYRFYVLILNLINQLKAALVLLVSKSKLTKLILTNTIYLCLISKNKTMVFSTRNLCDLI